MAESTEWDRISKFYIDVLEEAKPSTISWHLVACGKNMLSLIAQIRNDIDFEPFELALSHVTLLFGSPEHDVKVGVWGDEPGQYGIYNEYPGSVYKNEIVVSANEVIPALKEYLEPLRPSAADDSLKAPVEPTAESMTERYRAVTVARLMREMAHDVRTPLTAIIGYSQLLDMAISSDGKFSVEDQRHYVTMIMDSIKKIDLFLESAITVNDEIHGVAND